MIHVDDHRTGKGFGRRMTPEMQAVSKVRRQVRASTMPSGRCSMMDGREGVRGEVGRARR
jgi:hypothetical protein